jgi:hypothetical protein
LDGPPLSSGRFSLRVDITAIIVRWIKKSRSAVKAWLGPFWLGFLDGLGAVLGVFASALLIATALPSTRPSQTLFEDLAQIGATLFVAYSLATAAAAYRKDALDQHVNWLGSICSVGAMGMVSIGLSVALGADRGAGHASAWDNDRPLLDRGDDLSHGLPHRFPALCDL